MCLSAHSALWEQMRLGANGLHLRASSDRGHPCNYKDIDGTVFKNYVNPLISETLLRLYPTSSK